VKLALNEAGAEWSDPGTEIIRAGLLRLIDEIRDAGGRVDIIGLECHWMAQDHYDAGRFSDYLARLREKKVEIYITEIDVDDDRMPDDIGARDELVAKRYSEVLAVAVREPAVKAIITWDLIDPLSWYPGVYPRPPGSPRQPRPLLFDAQLQPKSSYRAVADALRSRVA
jgi:endo-1,4-beta-xylanase